MRSSTRISRRFAVLAAVTAAVAVAAPAAAQATIPSPVTSATWTLRTSWVNYLTNPVWYGYAGQGSITTTSSNGGTSAEDTSGAYASWPGFTDYAYGYVFGVASDTGTPRVVTLEGGLDFEMSVHGIDVRFGDLKVRDAGSGAEELVADVSYEPVAGGGTQHLYDTVVAHVSSAGAVTLTADGATAFNGGANGSYAAGSAFGTMAY